MDLGLRAAVTALRATTSATDPEPGPIKAGWRTGLHAPFVTSARLSPGRPEKWALAWSSHKWAVGHVPREESRCNIACANWARSRRRLTIVGTPVPSLGAKLNESLNRWVTVKFCFCLR